MSDVKEHKLSNIIKGWATSLFIGIPLLYLSVALPVVYGKLVLSYSPEWHVRAGMAGIGILAMLAPNKLPSIIQEAWDLVKGRLSK